MKREKLSYGHKISRYGDTFASVNSCDDGMMGGFCCSEAGVMRSGVMRSGVNASPGLCVLNRCPGEHELPQRKTIYLTAWFNARAHARTRARTHTYLNAIIWIQMYKWEKIQTLWEEILIMKQVQQAYMP